MISMKKKKFDTNEEYWRWYEEKEEQKTLNDYFIEEVEDE